MNSDPRQTGNGLTPLVIFLSVAAVYLTFLTKSYYWDGVTFALGIEGAGGLSASLFHPSHLFYSPLGYLAYRVTHLIGIGARALTVLQVCNCIFGALTAVTIYFAGRRIFRSTYIAAVLALLFAFSATWWKFATDADAYTPGIFFLMAAFYLVLPGGKPRPAAVAVLHILAICFHQLAVFFFPVIVVGLYLQSRDQRRNRLAGIVEYCVIAGASILGIYFLCFYLQTGNTNVRDLIGWMTYYSPENGFVFDASESISRTVGGTVKLFFGGRISYFTEALDWFSTALAAVDVLAFAGFVFMLFQSFRKRRTSEMPYDTRTEFGDVVLLCLTWTGTYLIFLFFWIPKNTFYRMFYLAPLLVLIVIGVSRIRVTRPQWALVPLFVTAMVLSNFLFFIYPYSRVRPDTPLALALEMNHVWTAKSVIYYSSMNSDIDLIRYFNPAPSWKKADPNTSDAELQQIYTSGGDAWVDHFSESQVLNNNDIAGGRAIVSGAKTVYGLKDPAYNLMFTKLPPAVDLQK